MAKELRFADPISEVYRQKLQTFLENILAQRITENRPPTIYFTGINLGIVAGITKLQRDYDRCYGIYLTRAHFVWENVRCIRQKKIFPSKKFFNFVFLFKPCQKYSTVLNNLLPWDTLPWFLQKDSNVLRKKIINSVISQLWACSPHYSETVFLLLLPRCFAVYAKWIKKWNANNNLKQQFYFGQLWIL